MEAKAVRTGTFGMHLTLDGYGGDPARLADPGIVRAWLDELPEWLAMTKLIEPYLIEVGAQNDKDPGGVTGFVLIAQSHLSVHTFPCCESACNVDPCCGVIGVEF